MTLAISPFVIPWQNHKHNYERSIKQKLHNYYKSQKYISLTNTISSWKICKKRDHGIIDLQLVLFETLKQDSLRHQVWNIYKLYTRRNMCIKRKKKQHMWDKVKNIHHIYIYIYIYRKKKYNVWVKRSQDNCTSKEKRYNKTSLYQSKTLSPQLVYLYASSPPNKKTTLIYKTTPPFCHEWQRVSH